MDQTRFPPPGPGRPSVEMMVKTLELAGQMLDRASECRNVEDAVFCRRAARDFERFVQRLLTELSPNDPERQRLKQAADALHTRLLGVGF